MISMKEVETKVRARDLTEAQGGVYLSPINPRLMVQCPESYVADEITAEDIMHDAAITLIEG
jgi:hypothetical protein